MTVVDLTSIPLYRCGACEVFGAELTCWCCGSDDLDALEPEDSPLQPTGEL